MPFKDWLPDFKGALNGFYDEKLKDTLEQKSSEYKELFTKHLEHWKNTQQALLIIAWGIFLLLLIAYFYPHNLNQPIMNQPKNMTYRMKHLAIGLIAFPVLFYVLTTWKKNHTTN